MLKIEGEFKVLYTKIITGETFVKLNEGLG